MLLFINNTLLKYVTNMHQNINPIFKSLLEFHSYIILAFPPGIMKQRSRINHSLMNPYIKLLRTFAKD